MNKNPDSDGANLHRGDEEPVERHQLQHDPHHGHDHGAGEEGHSPFQADVEDTAPTSHQLLAQALKEVLLEKGVFTAEELRREIEQLDSPTPENGAALVARAWLNPSFKDRLLENPQTAAAELGIDVGPRPIRIVANTPEIQHLIVCTLCSCYPRFLLGQPPDWYKSRNYRSRAVSDPRGVLAEFGTFVSDDHVVRVHDSTAEVRYMVLPMRPDATESLDELELRALVTRDCLIGVTLPRRP